MLFSLFNNLDFYIIIISTIFFFGVFQEVFSIQNIKKFFGLHPWIPIGIKFLGFVLFFGLLFYLSIDVCYAAGLEGNDLPKADVKVGDNTINIHNPNFNVPADAVAKGLTNVGVGAGIAGGMSYG